ncbi:MAG: hypothetical protein EA428_00015 [Spirochaetaceae bacterium]|nr:MAG: hypothetical protein EA428_00015 [Spirochaetaceae bacterium]
MKNNEVLLRSPFFHDIPTETRDQLLDLAEERQLKAGEELFHEGDPADALWIVLDGTLEAVTATAVTPAGEAAPTTRLGTLSPGDPIGEIAVLLGGRRSATVRALEDTRLAHFTRNHILAAADASPALHAGLEAVMQKRLERNRVVAAVHSFFSNMNSEEADFISHQLQRRVLQRGEYLFRFGDPGDALYIVVGGSFEVLIPSPSGEEVVVAHVRRGEPIGEMALLADDLRGASIRAARRSEVVALSREAFENVSLRYPSIILEITRVLVHRFRKLSGTGVSDSSPRRSLVLVQGGMGSLDLEAFAQDLAGAMPSGVTTAVVSSETVAAEFGSAAIAFCEPGDPRSTALDGRLEEIEAQVDIVLYVDSAPSAPPAGPEGPNAWIRRCLSRADELLMCAGAHTDSGLNSLERAVCEDADLDAPTHRRLVLLHEEHTSVPRGTSQWLAQRSVSSHLHLRTGAESDMQRLARDIAGRSVGLALGGGGARGIAHVGVMRALAERGVPVDKVSGTSMGAVVGALHGAGFDTQQMLEQIEEMFVKLNPFNEYTLPVYSLLRGRKPALASIRTFGTLRIEDLWIPFACTSTNVTRQELMVHKKGALAKAILASTALPGVTVPVVYDGEIHVDGGVINNLPGDLLRAECLSLITSDVNPVHHFGPAPTKFPSPWKVLMQGAAARTSNGAGHTAPRIGALLFASMNSGSQRAAAEVRQSADLSLTPEIEDIGLLDFKRLHEIAERGYDHTMRCLDADQFSSQYSPLSLL